MNETLGTLIRETRQAQGLSLRCLANSAGISPAALSNWETGKAQPRIPELKAVLDALRCPEALRLEAFSRIDAPRALAELRKTLPLPPTDPEPEDIWFPSSGDFLRSLRLRRQLSLEQASALLGVQPSTLSRWETSKTRLPESALNAYCTQMAVNPEERQALTHLFLAEPYSNGESVSLMSLEHQLEKLVGDVIGGSSRLTDLRFLFLEARMWRHAVQNATAWELLAKTYVWHAQWLLWQERLVEAGIMAKRAMRLEEQEAAPRRHWFRAGHIYATYLVDGEKRHNPERSIRFLQDCLPLARWPETQAWMYHNLATYLVRADQPVTALACVQQADVAARRSGNPAALRNANCDTAAILLRTGQCEAAYAALVESRQVVVRHNVYHQIYEAYIWTATLSRLGEASAAKRWQQQAQKIVQTYDLPSSHINFGLLDGGSQSSPAR